jgi:hypothetical protein
MRYKKSTLGIKEIGRELNVAYILNGSVRRADGKVRITARLTDTATDKNIWADTFNRDWNDIFAIQSDIAQQIAATLKATLTPAEKERIEKKPTKDIAVYEYCVRGREYYSGTERMIMSRRSSSSRGRSRLTPIMPWPMPGLRILIIKGSSDSDSQSRSGSTRPSRKLKKLSPSTRTSLKDTKPSAAPIV